MKFINFLNESLSNGEYKTKIDLEKASQLFLKECSRIDINKPLWRGMRGKDPSFILQGNAGKRQSISNATTHNIVLDDDISDHNSKYPLRSSSIIAITNGGKGYTDHFGSDRYAIYPYDKTVIGVCSHKDILEREYKGLRITDINELILDVTGLRGQYDLKELIDKIYKVVHEGDTDSDDDSYLEWFGKFFDDKSHGEIHDTLLDIYGIDNYDFVKNDSPKLSGSKEVWIGDKCIAVHEKYLDEFKKLVKDYDK